MRRSNAPQTEEQKVVRLQQQLQARRDKEAAEQSSLDEMVRKSIQVHGA